MNKQTCPHTSLEYQVGRFTAAPSWRCLRCNVAVILFEEDLELYRRVKSGHIKLRKEYR